MQAELFFSEMNGVTEGKRSAGALPNNRLVIVNHIASVAYTKYIIILNFSLNGGARTGQFYVLYFTVRPAKFKSLSELTSSLSI